MNGQFKVWSEIIMKLKVMDKLINFPGPRYRGQGEGSGEAFREDYLIPMFNQASKNGEKLVVDLDGAQYGYPTSFLEEAFGGIARKFGVDKVTEVLTFECNDEPLLVKEIKHYIKHSQESRTPPFE